MGGSGNNRPGPWASAAVAALCALVPCVFVPLQTWLGNSTALGFGLAPLLRELALLWLAVAVLLWLFVRLGGRLLGRLPLALVLAGTFYAYLETGILTIGSPPLDGGLDFWYGRTRTLADTAVLLAVFAGAIALRRPLARNAVLAAGAVALLSGASLFDVRGESIKTLDTIEDGDNPFAPGIVPRAEAVKRAFFSTNRNVVVFILDSTTTEVFGDVLDKEPEIARAFEGFRVYDDVVGHYATTPFGVASMFSGRPYDGSRSVGEYVVCPFSEASPLHRYLQADVPMFVQLGTFKKFAFVHLPGGAPAVPVAERRRPPVRRPVLAHRIEGEQGWNLSELIRFRLAPFAAKRYLMKAFMSGWRRHYRSSEEHLTQFEQWLFSKLSNARASGDCGLTLHVFHTHGVHEPFIFDRNGRETRPKRGYAPAYEYACFILGRLGRLLDSMRKSGVYDNSLIVVTADHGMSYSGRKTKHGVDVAETPIFNRAFPCFAVKASNEAGPPRRSGIPVDHLRFSSLLAEALDADPSADRVDELLRADGERVFTDMTKLRADGAWVDYVVLPDGSVTNRLSKPKRDVALLPAIQTGRDYSFKFLKNDALGSSYPPVACDGLSDARVWGAGFAEGKAGMTMRVPDPGARYDVTLVMNILQPTGSDENVLFMGRQRFFLRNASRGTVRKLVGRRGDSATVTLHDLAPAADGTLTVTAEKSGTAAQVFFVSLRVEEKKRKSDSQP